ncbi:MAG TPA: dihydrodipicolinate reductase [Planctomycetota bacterium]|nr:dihydrodipicolinate reductase [Planctomycetota bacterium]
MHRLLHVGLGPLGQRIQADLIERRSARVAAAVDTSPRLAGRLLAEVVPGAAPGTMVLGSIEEALERAPFDCALLTTSSDLVRCAPSLRALLGSGVSVVSTCEELWYPWLRHAALAGELDGLAREHGARLVGTGVNPGFLMDALPLFASAACREVRAVRAWRIQDATQRRTPFQLKIGAGLDPAEFAERAAAGEIRHVGLGESLHFLAHYLHLPLEEWSESIEPVITERELECAAGRIAPGAVAGVRQLARASGRGREVLRLEFQAAIGQADPHDRIAIDGEPAVDLVLRGGLHGDAATSALLLNTIRPLLAAPAGLHTMATLPLPYCG